MHRVCETRQSEACNGPSTTQWSSTFKPCFTNPCATMDSGSCVPYTVCIGWRLSGGVWLLTLSLPLQSLHLTQFAVRTLCSNCRNCLLARHVILYDFYDMCNAWYMALGSWVDLIRCPLNQLERLPTLPFDWGKLVYSVTNQNPGLMRYALS